MSAMSEGDFCTWCEYTVYMYMYMYMQVHCRCSHVHVYACTCFMCACVLNKLNSVALLYCDVLEVNFFHVHVHVYAMYMYMYNRTSVSIFCMCGKAYMYYCGLCRGFSCLSL